MVSNGKSRTVYFHAWGGVPGREESFPEPLACEVGWPVPSLAGFIFPVFPLSNHLQLGER